MKILEIPFIFRSTSPSTTGQFTGAVRVKRGNDDNVYCTGLLENRLICIKSEKNTKIAKKPIKLFHNYFFRKTDRDILIDGELHNVVQILGSKFIQLPEWIRLKRILFLLKGVNNEKREEILGVEGIHSENRLQSVCNSYFSQPPP